MSYVEWLRVRNCLKGVAYVMLAFILIVAVVRVAYWKEVGSTDAFLKHITMDAGSKVSNSTLPDGTPRTTIEDPDGTVATIDGGGSLSRHIVISEPIGKSSECDNLHVVNASVSCKIEGDKRVITIETNAESPIWIFIAFGTVTSFIIATLLGAPFARENDGHLEIAAMRPLPRYMLALQTVGVDLAGIVLANAVTVVGLVICQLMFEMPRFSVDSTTPAILVMAVVGPAAWYALLTAATSSLKRGYTAIIGFAWPVAALVVVFGMISWPDSILGQVMHNVFSNVMWIDPLAYGNLHFQMNVHTGELVQSTVVWRNILMESILFLAYGALAIFQWQRVEA